MSLVRATFELQDGSRHGGFLTPAAKEGDLGTLQPHLFVGGESFGFWGSLAGIRADKRTAFYQALGKGPEAIFPIRFSTAPDLATGVVAGFIVVLELPKLNFRYQSSLLVASCSTPRDRSPILEPHSDREIVPIYVQRDVHALRVQIRTCRIAEAPNFATGQDQPTNGVWITGSAFKSVPEVDGAEFVLVRLSSIAIREI